MTQTVLEIQSSARFDGSVTRKLTAEYLAKADAGTVITRELTQGVELLNPEWVGATFTPVDDRTDAQKAALKGSDVLVAELMAADTILIGAPIYNFSVPAALKAWIDQICRVGVTFQYTENGPVGLLNGKRAVIVMASGGVPVGSDMDFASNYLRFVLGFIGITDVTIIAADGMNSDDGGKLEQAKTAVAAAA
jgi:FMN-dependent NADH-azoreductase